ncbi:MAG TPA: MFS transporter [Streptosporangiaceae bacterium]|nr:MFS transporter [Streptosporangiaceae bacterium]
MLADRNLRVLFVGQSMNMFGNSAMLIVLGIWVKDLTGSSAEAGLIFLLITAAAAFAPTAGLLVDRFPRRPLLLINDILTALVVALLLAVHTRQDVWLVYIVTTLYGVSGLIYRAARGGLVHSMVPDELLGDTNGLFNSLFQAARILGPLVGAAMYAAWGGAVVVWVDIATFAFSAVSYLALRRVPDLVRPAGGRAAHPGETLGRELVAGIRHVMTNPLIRRMVLSTMAAFAGAGPIDVAMFSLVTRGLHKPAAVIGVVTSIEAAGSVVAGICVGPLMRRFGEYAVACAGFVLMGIGIAMSSLATMPTVVLGSALLGVGLPLVLVAELTLVQRRTPAELQGRAIAASEAITATPFTISIGLGAVIIGPVGFRPIYIWVAVGFVVVGLALLPYLKVTKPQPVAEPVVDEDQAIAVPGS